MTRRAFAPRGVRIAIAVLGTTLAVYAVQAALQLGGPGASAFFTTWVYGLLAVGASVLCLARVVLVRAERAAWSCFFVGLAAWTVADGIWLIAPEAAGEPPVVWLTDVLYLTMYPGFYCGLVLLMRARLRPFRASLWLDGVAGGFAVAALAAALVLDPILRNTANSAYDTVVALAYPLGDLLLVIIAIAAIGMTGWKPGRAWALVALGGIAGAAADTVYLYRTAAGTWEDGTIVDVAWSASMLATALAAWCRAPRGRAAARQGWLTIELPAGFALCSLGVLVIGNLTTVSPAAAALAAAGLLAALGRAGLTYVENLRMLRRREDEAMTDGLSGLANRRKLMYDLEHAADQRRPTTLVFFDLNGFKQYNDTFGHGAGDALLARLGAALAASLGSEGRAYRLGGDEFCALLRGRHEADGPMVQLAAAALSETGGGFSVTASFGSVVLPDEALSANEALGLADERMYGQKRSGRFSGRQQARSVLLQVQSEREPDVHIHANSVTELALMVGRRLSLEADAMDVLGRAAELHDIGKVAIPEEILRKPGPLTEGEWAFVRQHTVIGERILSAAPALAPVGKVVRATHERWDGHGYPDGLAAESIPLEARVIYVCDAFDAMVSDRPYRKGITAEEALAELERCAGSQFDPAVVSAFVRAVAEDGLPERDARTSRAA